MQIEQAEELASLFTVELPPRPYPGLRPFEKSEWAIFFGREPMADKVVAQLITKHLLVIHGDSGCGKSSLVRAGVLPRLEQENARGGIRWRTCAMTPGESPLWNLAEALAVMTGNAPNTDRVFAIRRALNAGRDAPPALSELLRENSQDQIGILIDQFEELFAHAERHGPEEARLVTQLLTALYTEPPEGLYVMVTMRSEFLGACARYDDFAETVNATQYLLPRMRHDDLLRAIREPATLFDGEISRDLAERLIADAGGAQDELPLIQHGLMLLYRDHAQNGCDYKTMWRLDLQHYDKNRGLKGLLSNHADATALAAARSDSKSEEGSRLVEDLFRCLTDINADGQAIRRPQTFGQLLDVTRADEPMLRSIVDEFRADGVSFLRPYGSAPVGADTLIDISHEALIRCWQKIAEAKDGWLHSEFRNGLVWQSLLVQADSFDRDPTNVLAPTTTDEREQWMRRRSAAWAQRYGGGWERVQKLLAASAIERDRIRSEQTALRKREEESRLRDQRFTLMKRAGVLMLLLSAGLLYTTWEATQQQLKAKHAQLKAEQERDEARLQFESANAARELSDQLRAKAEESAKELRQLGKLLTASAPLGAKGTATSTVQAIEQVAGKLSQSYTKPVSGPRVYLHITDSRSRAAAHDFELELEAITVGDAKVTVPSIQLVKASPRRAELRCFQAEECQGNARRLLELANSILEEPQLELQDLSARYGESTGIRPRHYEIWFPKGDIRLRSAKAK